MLPKLSVKKPFTILVAVILVIVLGVMSVTKMTPDLLPEMSFPYVVIFTTCPGASPEEVEETITKPMEQTMAALDDLKEITSTSSENVSVVFLTFDDGTNIDNTLIDVHQSIAALQSGWDDTVSAPMVMELSTNLVPTIVSSVAIEGMDTLSLSEFVNDTLMNDLEGINGVASVTTYGIVSRKIEIVPDPEKIDALNEQLFAAIDEEFSEATQELEDAKQTILEGEQALEDGREQLDEGQAALSSGKHQANRELASAEQELNDKKQELLDAQATLTQQQAELKTALESTQSALSALRLLSQAVRGLDQAQALLDASIAEIEQDPTLSEEEKAAQIDAILNGTAASAIALAYAEIDEQLAPFGIGRGELDATISDLTEAEATLTAALAEIDAALPQIEEGLIAIEDGYILLEEQKDEILGALNRAQGAINAGKEELELGEEELKLGKEELEKAEELAKEQLAAAKDAADLHNILTKEMIAQLLSAQSFSMPAGYLTDGETQWVVNVGDSIDGMAALESVVLFSPNVGELGAIRLTDVASIDVVDNSGSTYAKINGENGVLLSFTKQSSYATATVSENVKERLDELSDYYDGISFVALLDQGDYIEVAMDSVVQNLLMGGALAILILLLFLRDLRPTLVVGISIPVSVLFALVLMYFSGVTMNVISMAGLAIGIGMLVDNSIVVIENIYRLRTEGVPIREAALTGTKQVLGAITASTLTTICVFVPILFVEGITRQIFMDMVLTVAFSLLASLLVAITVIPAMVTGVMRRPVKPQKEGSKRFYAFFERILRTVLNHRVPALLLAVVILLGTAFFSLRQGFVMFPESGGNQLSVSLRLPEDMEFTEACALADEAAMALDPIPEITDLGIMIGSGILDVIGMASGEASEVTIYALLDTSHGANSLTVSKDAKEALKPLEDRCSITVSGMGGMDFSAMTGESGVSVRVYANDSASLTEAATQVSQALASVPGLKDVDDGLGDTAPALHVSVDREAAMKHGLTVAQVYLAVAEALTTEITGTEIYLDTTSLNTVIRTNDTLDSIEKLEALRITATLPDGTTEETALGEFAVVEQTTTLASIARENQRRCVTVSAAVSEGGNVTLLTPHAEEAVRALSLPSGASYVFDGENEAIYSALTDLFWMLLLGILIIYLIMVAQFQSLLSPFIVLGTLPLAFAGGFIGLLVTGNQVSIVAMIGMIMLVGIAVNNGIVLVDCANQLRDEGYSKREAVIKAASMRLRPVMMTALTTILGLLPLAIGFGTGAEIIQPVAIVCIGGLTYATLLTMFIIPVLYDLLRREQHGSLVQERLRAKDA